MKNCLFKFSMIAVAALFLSSCSPGPVDHDTGEVFSLTTIPEQKFVAGGFDLAKKAAPKLVKDFTDDEFRNVLSALDPELCKTNQTLEKCIEKFNQSANSGKNFQGLSGLTGRALLDTAESKKNAAGKKEVKVSGQILDQCAHDPSLEGYAYDASAKTLRLCVYMVTEIGKPKNKKKKFTYQYFHVEATSAHVDDKNLNDPTNVFPNAYQKTGLKVSAAMATDFEFKLYAAGRHISLENYWEATAESKYGNPQWKKYQKGQSGMPKKVADYFKPDPDACVDLMFPVSGVPPYLDEGAAGGVHYCLGRCKNPPIVNTR